MSPTPSMHPVRAGALTADSPALPPLPVRRPVLLVVDDDEPLRQALRLIFEYQYEVVLAASGPHALSLIQRGLFDVAIVDIRMPGMSGFEFLERSRTVDPDIQTVILSGQSTFEMARQAVRLDAFDFLPKPFDLQVLRQTIQQAARRRAWLRFEKKREAALQRAVTAAEMAAQERDLLVSLLSEFRAPLNTVSAGAAALDQEMTRQSTPSEPQVAAWRRQLQELGRQATLCVQLAGSPRQDLSSPGPPEGVPAAQVMDDLGRLLRVHPSSKGHQLTIRPPALPSGLKAREADLLRILVNLGRNALESSEVPHRVDFESWLVNEPVLLDDPERSQGRFVLRETFENRPPLLAIAVKDDGPGISPEIWPHLFHTAVTTKPGKGDVGLGLTSVRDLVAATGCALEIRSEPGFGTTATLYVPVVHPVDPS